MRRAAEAEFGPLGVSTVRCAAIADRMLATLAREGWAVTPVGEPGEVPDGAGTGGRATGEYPLERDDGLPDG